jgi:clathrin heavy chain
LPGADDLYTAQFNSLLAANDVPGAARLAAESPRGILHTPLTILRFQQIPGQSNQPQPVFQYFSILLEKGKLNGLESLELARPDILQGRPQLLEKWFGEDKLEPTEELGDLLMPVSADLALKCYLKVNAPEKTINCLMQRGEFDKIVAYDQKVNYRMDYSFMLQQLVRSNPAGAVEFAKKLIVTEPGQVQLIDANSVMEIFMSVGL